MEKQIRSFVRVAVAGVMVLAGVAAVSTTKAQASTSDQIKAANILQEGAMPAPTCSPTNPRCTMPNVGW